RRCSTRKRVAPSHDGWDLAPTHGHRRASLRASELRHRSHARRDAGRVHARGRGPSLMCGIAGHFGAARGADVRVKMRAALARRGPDAQHDAAFDGRGRRLADDAVAEVGLVHTRLSIIDPRPIADQPMASDDGTIWILYNGEVYGWQNDARQLEGR